MQRAAFLSITVTYSLQEPGNCHNDIIKLGALDEINTIIYMHIRVISLELELDEICVESFLRK